MSSIFRLIVDFLFPDIKIPPGRFYISASCLGAAYHMKFDSAFFTVILTALRYGMLFEKSMGVCTQPGHLEKPMAFMLIPCFFSVLTRLK